MRALQTQGPDVSSVSGQKRYTIVPPSIHREGIKKSIFENVREAETSGHQDRFQPKQLETVLRKYISVRNDIFA